MLHKLKIAIDLLFLTDFSSVLHFSAHKEMEMEHWLEMG